MAWFRFLLVIGLMMSDEGYAERSFAENAKSGGGAPDLSMQIIQAAKAHLATREVALGSAELLIKSSYGDDELSKQKPLKVTEDGDNWEIEGSRYLGEYPVEPSHLDYGKVEIRIAKTDCRVLKIIREAELRPTTKAEWYSRAGS